MIVRYIWDDSYLYIGYEVSDTNIVAVGNGAIQGPQNNRREGCSIWENPPRPQVNVVEFFITFESDMFFWELHHNASNQFNDVLIVTGLPSWKQDKPAFAQYNIYFGNEEFIQDEGDAKFASAVALMQKPDGILSTVNCPTDSDAGYTAEIRLPWYGIGAPLSARKQIVESGDVSRTGVERRRTIWHMDRKKISILAVCHNEDASNRYHHSAPGLKGGWFHTQTASYPAYLLAAPGSK